MLRLSTWRLDSTLSLVFLIIVIAKIIAFSFHSLASCILSEEY